MRGDARHALAGGQSDHREDVVLVAVHATRREQAEHVQGAAARLRRRAGREQGFVARKAAIGNRRIDAGEILVDDAARTDVHVADFGIAHLPVRQSDMQAMGVDQGVRTVAQQGVPVRQPRLRKRVVRGLFAMAPAIEDQQQDGLRAGHGGMRSAGVGK